MTRSDELNAEIRNHAALWYVGGMISGALIMIAFLDS
nr:MAG TPA: capsid protein [Caudoviricetes sp.]DAS91141.1 MAG TPA: capsid protein [Caudoviricetes sp.]